MASYKNPFKVSLPSFPFIPSFEGASVPFAFRHPCGRRSRASRDRRFCEVRNRRPRPCQRDSPVFSSTANCELSTVNWFAHFAHRYLLFFHANTNCPIYNPFVVITMQIALGVGIPHKGAGVKVILEVTKPFRMRTYAKRRANSFRMRSYENDPANPFRMRSSEKTWGEWGKGKHGSRPVQWPTLVLRIPRPGRGVRRFFGSSPTFNFELSTVSRRKSFRMNTCETPFETAHSKGFTESLSPLESALTKKVRVGGCDQNEAKPQSPNSPRTSVARAGGVNSLGSWGVTEDVELERNSPPVTATALCMLKLLCYHRRPAQSGEHLHSPSGETGSS